MSLGRRAVLAALAAEVFGILGDDVAEWLELRNLLPLPRQLPNLLLRPKLRPSRPSRPGLPAKTPRKPSLPPNPCQPPPKGGLPLLPNLLP